jgi:hypothetical protein
MSGPDTKALAEALDHLVARDWHAAHRLVQDLEDPIACRIHGLVHRIEGDLSNSRYWYGRAGVPFDPARPIDGELADLHTRLRELQADT